MEDQSTENVTTSIVDLGRNENESSENRIDSQESRNGSAGNPGSENFQPAPRRRGRPPGSKNRKPGAAAIDVAGNPASAADLAEPPASRKRGPGRPPKTAPTLAVDSLAPQIFGAHKILSVFLKDPLFEVSEAEAKNLARAIINVSEQYAIEFDPRLVAWVQLFGVSAAIYGPRVIVYRAKKAAQQKSQPSPSPDNVMRAKNVGKYVFQ